jgi:hypothetical protein
MLPPMDHHAQGSRYEIAFSELHAPPLESVTLRVEDLPDQGALLGVLSRIESLGLELLEVRRGNSVRTRWVPPGLGGA